jgi:hypothetical protein
VVVREREILERAVRTIAEQAVKADELVGEANAAGGGDHPVTVAAKMLRLELLKVKAELERNLSELVLDCTACGMDVHWVQGISMSDPGTGRTLDQRRMASRSSSCRLGIHLPEVRKWTIASGSRWKANGIRCADA